MDSKQDQERVETPLRACPAILLCESVIRDEFTQKTTIVGILDTFFVPDFPGITVPCTLYLRFRRLVGLHTVGVEVYDVESGAALFRKVGSAEFGNPSDTEPSELRMPIA